MWKAIRTILAARCVEILLFVLLWLTYAYFYQSSQHNEAARFDQTRSILEDGVLYIEKYRYNTADVVAIARDGGPPHTYPNKAPGTSFLAIPAFWLWKHVLKLFHLEEWVYWHFVAYLTTLTTVSLLSVLAALAMYALLRRVTGDVVFSALTVVAIWLGTICFPFSTLFFSHQQAAAQLILAFYFLFKLRWDGVGGRVRCSLTRAGVAGLLCGFTLATEYPTILLVGLLCAYFGATLVQSGSTLRIRLGLGGLFCVGFLVGLAPLIAYNVAISGEIFFTPYEAYAQPGAASPFPGHRQGYVGIHWPGWRNFVAVLAEITVRPQRGLLYIGVSGWRVYACNPVLWLALPGLIWLFLRKPYRLEAALIAAMTLAYFMFNACYGDSIVYWGGAWSVGPRHLIPLLPFLALPLIEGARRLWFLFYPLFLVCIFYMLLATAVEPRVPYEYANPARDLFADKYLRGNLALNRLGLFDLQQRSLTANSTAFNWSKLIGLPGSTQLILLMLFWLAAGGGLIWAIWSNREKERENPPSAVSDRPSAIRGQQTAVGNPRPAIRNLLRPHFSPWAATAVWAIFVGAISLAPPLHALHLKRELATGGGLLGKYYSNMRWQGSPAFVRKDRWINFDWTMDPPFAGQFSVEWAGTIRIDRPGQYLFATESDDGSFLALDGKIIVNNDGAHARRKIVGRTEITRSGRYPLAIRYFNDQYNGMVRVTWQPPGEAEQLLPPEILGPPDAGGETK